VITKEIAVTLHHGQILHHKTLKNADKTPLRVRINGKTQTWKTRPADFRIPVKYGFRECLYIECIDGNGNFNEWEV
jgi:hypothetical protein